MLLGHWLEMRSVRQASSALNELAKLMPDTAERLTEDGNIEEVAVSHLQAGDKVLVRPGASVPADGEIIEGRSDVNEAMITGESKPVKKQPGDAVIAGTVNGDGSLLFAAGQKSDRLLAYTIDRQTGKLTLLESREATGTPIWVMCGDVE